MLLIPTYMVAMYATGKYMNQIACLFFVLAASTDWLDGYIARKYNLVSNMGKVLDPVADKIMVAAAMIVLVDLDRLATWIVVLMFFRDFAVGALRDLAASQGTIIAAGIWGKLKTVLQMIAIGALIFYDSFVLWPLSAMGVATSGINISNTVIFPAYALGTWVMYAALAISLFSGAVYFKQYYKSIKI
jgi:CDP-diacylglycerol--glycerol-3-phosphate 3-phosphatidyltransferase/cardiolipin synthase